MKITDQHKAELNELNYAVEAAVKARTEWLDRHMSEYAKFSIGDVIYSKDGSNGSLIRLGKCTGYYRYWGPLNDGNGNSRDERFDTSLNISYKIEGGDNTSCRSGCTFFTQEEVTYNALKG